MLGSAVSSGRDGAGGLGSGRDAVWVLPLANIFWDYSALTAPRCVARGTSGLERGQSAGRQLLLWPVGFSLVWHVVSRACGLGSLRHMASLIEARGHSCGTQA